MFVSELHLTLRVLEGFAAEALTVVSTILGITSAVR